jgi:hypothetical protein
MMHRTTYVKYSDILMFVMLEVHGDTVDQCAETAGRYLVLMLVSIQNKVF